MILPLVKKNDPILKTVSERVEVPFSPEEMKPFLKDLYDTMYHKKGIGLAAVQVGVPTRIFVVDVKGMKYTFINPVVVSTGENVAKLPEGCLSLPGEIVQKVPRYEQIEIQAYNEFGRSYGIVCTGLLARCVQHEMDHLDGILINSRVKQGLKGYNVPVSSQAELNFQA